MLFLGCSIPLVHFSINLLFIFTYTRYLNYFHQKSNRHITRIVTCVQLVRPAFLLLGKNSDLQNKRGV